MGNKDYDLKDLGLSDDFDPNIAAKTVPPKLSSLEVDAADAERERVSNAKQHRQRKEIARQATESRSLKIVEAVASFFWGLPLSFGGYMLIYYFFYDITVPERQYNEVRGAWEFTGERYINDVLANNRISGLIIGAALFVAGTIKVNFKMWFGSSNNA